MYVPYSGIPPWIFSHSDAAQRLLKSIFYIVVDSQICLYIASNRQFQQFPVGFRRIVKNFHAMDRNRNSW